MTGITCPYCSAAAIYSATSAHIYSGRDYGPVWACKNFPRCDSYVGAHPDGSPKGRLADKSLRRAKMAAHAVFDPLWQEFQIAYPDATRSSGKLRRTMRLRAYEWLSDQMGLAFDDCHIGMFDEAQCAKAIRIIAETKVTAATIRAWAKARREAA